MLPAAHRVRRRGDFTAAVRSGRRDSRPTLVMYYVAVAGSAVAGPEAPARAGFVVSRTVGNAVTRNTVRRRLRELVRPQLGRLPAGSLLIVRATPAAAHASSSKLAGDLSAALERIVPARSA